MINEDELVDYNKKIEYEDLSKEELVKLIKLQDTYNEVHNEILNLKDKVINLMAIELFNYANLNILGICEAELENGNYDMNLCKMSSANRNCCECIKEYFYKKADEEIQKNKAI